MLRWFPRFQVATTCFSCSPPDLNLAVNHFHKSYCSTVHFRRITSIYQPTNTHIISHKTLLKHFDMFRSCQIIIRELCSLLKLCYSIPSSIRICKRGVVAAYHVVWECVVEQWLGVRRIRRTPSHCSLVMI